MTAEVVCIVVVPYGSAYVLVSPMVLSFCTAEVDTSFVWLLDAFLAFPVSVDDGTGTDAVESVANVGNAGTTGSVGCGKLMTSVPSVYCLCDTSGSRACRICCEGWVPAMLMACYYRWAWPLLELLFFALLYSSRSADDVDISPDLPGMDLSRVWSKDVSGDYDAIAAPVAEILKYT